MDDSVLHVNGINGSTGAPLVSGLTLGQVAQLARGKPIETDEHHASLLAKWWRRLTTRSYAPTEGIDPCDLAQAGWGVIFNHRADPAVREALAPLLALRQGQAGAKQAEYYKELTYRPGESKRDFLIRHKSSPGVPAHPARVPTTC
jgi:hypothetical protein